MVEELNRLYEERLRQLQAHNATENAPYWQGRIDEAEYALMIIKAHIDAPPLEPPPTTTES